MVQSIQKCCSRETLEPEPVSNINDVFTELGTALNALNQLKRVSNLGDKTLLGKQKTDDQADNMLNNIDRLFNMKKNQTLPGLLKN